MSTQSLQAGHIKKRAAPKQPRGLAFPTLALSGSGRNVYKMQERAATHEEMMQRFQLRKVPSDKSFQSKFRNGKHVVIDKATGSRRRKTHRFSLQRSLRDMSGKKARQQFFRTLVSPITPRSWTSTAHGFLMLVIYHFQLLYLPFSPSYFPNGSYCSTVATILMESVFLLDLLLNFNTAYVEHGALVTSRAKIAAKYLRNWFVFDLMSAVPIQAIYCFVTNTIVSFLSEVH